MPPPHSHSGSHLPSAGRKDQLLKNHQETQTLQPRRGGKNTIKKHTVCQKQRAGRCPESLIPGILLSFSLKEERKKSPPLPAGSSRHTYASVLATALRSPGIHRYPCTYTRIPLNTWAFAPAVHLYIQGHYDLLLLYLPMLYVLLFNLRFSLGEHCALKSARHFFLKSSSCLPWEKIFPLATCSH